VGGNAVADCFSIFSIGSCTCDPGCIDLWIFPDSVIAASGKFAGLTVRATGAFIGYFVILLVTYPVVQGGKILLKSQRTLIGMSGLRLS
jgi:hypothetical protein